MKKHLWILTVAALLACLNGHAAPVFQTVATDVGESSTLTVEKPMGTQAGDLLVAALMLDQGKRVGISAPSGWVLVHRKDNSRRIGMGIYYHIANESEPASYSFPLNKNVKWAASISRISGTDIENPIGGSGSSSGRNGNVTAPSITTSKDNALILAFYTNRRNATYTPHSATTERCDAPNTPEGRPSNMLATFEQTTAGVTGNKTANPSRSDRHWVGIQISIAPGEEAAADLSGFRIAATGNPLAGDTVSLQITSAKAMDGSPLSGTVAVTVTSNLDGSVFDHAVTFDNGEATISIALSTVATHTLTTTLAGVTDPQTQTVTVNRRPITLTANPQSKMEDDPDPALTWTLTAGSLLEGIPLTGEPSRDSGEDAGLYAIRQGSLTDVANPNYAITFVSADFEILAAEENVRLIDRGIWTSAEEIAHLPMSGEPWRLLKRDADLFWGAPNLSDKEDRANLYAMSKALVYARTGIIRYRTEVIEACMQAIGTEEGSSTLAVGRNLGAFAIAADLVGLPPEEEAIFRTWLREMLTKVLPGDGRSLTTCHEMRPNNWGCHAGGSRAAVAAYLQDWDELARVAQVFKGWLGDRESYAGFAYQYSLAWQADPDKPVGINPLGSTIQGHNVSGVLPDDQRRFGDGTFSWPPPKENYVYEALQGALLQAVILHRAGYDVWNWEDQALLRAFTWLHEEADYLPVSDDLWQPFIINYFYGTDFPTTEASRCGKNVARTCWTHQKPPTE